MKARRSLVCYLCLTVSLFSLWLGDRCTDDHLTRTLTRWIVDSRAP